MKKLVLILALLIGFLGQAQDFELLKKAYRSDLTFTREFSDKVAGSFRGNYTFLDARESKKGDVYSILYLPESVSEETTKRIKQSIDYAYTGQCKECLQVVFKVVMEGQNADFEREGVKKYMFNIVRGNFLDLLPFWKMYIAPNDVAESISEKGYSSIRDEKNKIIFNFRRDSQGWNIQNYSDRIKQ